MRRFNIFFLAILAGLIGTTSLLPNSAHALTASPIRLELQGDPGSTVDSFFTLFNEEKETRHYFITAWNFEAKGETGEPVVIKDRAGLATWIRMQEDIVIKPGERLNIPFSVSIPRDAEPGGHFAGVFASIIPRQDIESNSVAVEGDLGTLVLLTVSGEFRDGADILDFGTKDKKKFFISLPTDFFYRFQNTGQDRAKPLGDIVVTNMFGGTSKIIPANPDGGNVLPRSIRRFEASWKTRAGETEDPASPRPPDPPPGFWNKVRHEWKYFALGRYRATLTLTYGQDQQRTSAGTVFWVVPWQLLVVGLLALAAILALATMLAVLIVSRIMKRRK